MTLNNNQRNSIWLWFFLALCAVAFLSSCGVRKVDKSHSDKLDTLKESSKIVDTTKTVKTNSLDENVSRETKTEVTATEVTETETIKPVDPTKPASFTDEKGNKKDITNAVWKRKKTTNKKSENKTEKAQAIKSKKGSEMKQNGNAATNNKEALSHEIQDNKSTFSIGFSWWWFLLLLIPLIWFLYRKYKDKIWWM